MLVQKKTGTDRRVYRPLQTIAGKIGIFRPLLDSLPLKLYPKRTKNEFSVAMLPNMLQKDIASFLPDIIHLHWMCHGFISIENLKRIQYPLIWTLHDMWPFTGGCHVDNDCRRYAFKCGKCPQLNSTRKRDLSYRTWQRKLSAWRNIDLTIVTPSHWLAGCAKKSSLFMNHRIHVIPNGLNLDRFKPFAKESARQLWNLPQDKKLILFGAISASGDRNKGMHLMLEALQSLDQSKLSGAIELVVFGTNEPKISPRSHIKTRYMGRLYDDVSLASLYSAADVMVVPSIQESFGQTAAEAIACGTPVVCFSTTGLKDIIDHKVNGYLASCYQPEDLAKGIQWVLKDKAQHKKLCLAARQKAEKEYDIDKVAKQYKNLYQDILSP